MNLRFLRWMQKRLERGRVREIDGVVIDDETRRRGLAFLTALIDAVEADPRAAARQGAEVGGAFVRHLQTALDSYEIPVGMKLTPDVKKIADCLFHAAMREAARATADELAPRVRGATGGREAAKTKKKRAEGEWRSAARRLVKKLSEGRVPSKQRLIDTIKDKWEGDATALPGDKQIRRLIDEMVRDGEISLDA